MPEKVRIYALLFGLTTIGYLWVIISFINGSDSSITVCPIKTITNYPCPSCGITRACMYILEGSFLKAIQTNPIGYVVFIMLIICPIWLCYDMVFKKDTLWNAYKKTEILLSNKKLAIPLIALILANWAWNISKSL